MEKAIVGTHMTQEDYTKLAHACSTNEAFSNDAAIILINKEFGFEASQIEILTEAKTYKIVNNRVKLTYIYERAPLYSSSDWNYIRFSVAGWHYEMINGVLYFYEN